jgi:hypothetical protein
MLRNCQLTSLFLMKSSGNTVPASSASITSRASTSPEPLPLIILSSDDDSLHTVENDAIFNGPGKYNYTLSYAADYLFIYLILFI